MNKWTKNKLAEIASGEISEGSIRVIRLRVSRALSRPFGTPYTVITADEAAAILDAIETHKPRVSDAQAAKGAAWLRGAVFTPKGARRATEFASEFSARDCDIIGAEIREFRLVELRDLGINGWAKYFPVYRAFDPANAARSFDYLAAAWQSGQSFIVRHAP